jgi:hypothetical protein
VNSNSRDRVLLPVPCPFPQPPVKALICAAVAVLIPSEAMPAAGGATAACAGAIGVVIGAATTGLMVKLRGFTAVVVIALI